MSWLTTAFCLARAIGLAFLSLDEKPFASLASSWATPFAAVVEPFATGVKPFVAAAAAAAASRCFLWAFLAPPDFFFPWAATTAPAARLAPPASRHRAPAVRYVTLPIYRLLSCRSFLPNHVANTQSQNNNRHNRWVVFSSFFICWQQSVTN